VRARIVRSLVVCYEFHAEIDLMYTEKPYDVRTTMHSQRITAVTSGLFTFSVLLGL